MRHRLFFRQLQGKGRRGGGGGGRGNSSTANGSGWRDYAPFDKNNEKLESYYNSLLQLPEEEEKLYWEYLRRELPNSFRFTGSRGCVFSIHRHHVQSCGCCDSTC